MESMTSCIVTAARTWSASLMILVMFLVHVFCARHHSVPLSRHHSTLRSRLPLIAPVPVTTVLCLGPRRAHGGRLPMSTSALWPFVWACLGQRRGCQQKAGCLLFHGNAITHSACIVENRIQDSTTSLS